MIQYTQSPPSIRILGSADRVYYGGVYSGFAEGLNNPALEAARNLGPIPRGQYEIRCWSDRIPGKGPCVAILRPLGDAHGRSGFLIHGDNAAGDHTASHGCIIAPLAAREWLRASGETQLVVV